MGTLATDDFNGTTGTELSAYSSSWTQHTSYAQTARIAASTRARAYKTSGAALTAYYHSTTASSANYNVTADIYLATASTNTMAAACGRMSNSANTLYYAGLFYNGTSWDLKLYKIVAGTSTQLGTAASGWSTGSTNMVTLKMSGTTIEAWKEGSSSYDLQATDSAITATGYGGLRMYTTGTPSDTSYAQIEYWDISEADAAGQPYIKRLGGVPFAAMNRGVW